ncbi:MAG: hypothetical protein H0X62_10760, partial [Bacteroidetes bacterium]|nr:hypothetical protein [Bacteroidota bacterium]
YQANCLTLILGLICVFQSNAQDVKITHGGKAPFEITKGSDILNYSMDGNRYYISTYFKNVQMNYDFIGYNNSGENKTSGRLEIHNGVMGNGYFIKEVLPLGNSMYAIIENRNKSTGKNTLLARTISENGFVSKSETELISFPYEKMMNSGTNKASVSPDQKTMAIVSEMPFENKMPAVYKIALFDEHLKEIKSGEITLTEENTKNKNITVLVGNKGAVYIIKKTSTKNGEPALDVVQWTGSGSIKEYSIDLTPPVYMFSYVFAVNPNDELIISGTYHERKVISAGEKQARGIFYFTNKGMDEKILHTFPLDNAVDNLRAQKVIINNSTVFLVAEQFKETKNPPPAGVSTVGFEHTYTYTHKDNHIFGLDADGNKKFQVVLNKDFETRDFNQIYQSGYFIVNDKLTVVYNDNLNKYVPGISDSRIVPVISQITNDGLMKDPIVFKDKLKLPGSYLMYPSFSVQDSQNQISVLIGDRDNFELTTISID